MIKTRTANKMAYVERWVSHFGDDENRDAVIAEKQPNGKWLCEIELPLINQTIRHESTNHMNALLKASEKATKVIQFYLLNHPEVKWIPLSKVRNWELTTNDDGYMSLNLTKNYRRKIGKQMEQDRIDSINIIKKALAKLNKKWGENDHTYIQVVGHAAFSDDMKIKDILREVEGKFMEDYKLVEATTCYDKETRSVITFGYTMPREEK